LKTLLTLEYNSIIKASMDITEDELRRLRGDKSLENKVRRSPLRGLLLSLVDLLETDSEEFQALEKQKGALSLAVAHAPSSTMSIAGGESPSILPSTPTYSQPRFPQSYDAVDNKRKLSETSFGTRSTETTPIKLVHPEAKVQALQNTFVKTIIDTLWVGKVDIPWAKGRHMFLTYTEYPISYSPLTCRTNNMSFQYSLRSNSNETIIGRVRAIADGALRLKTNKIKDERKYGIWSKQRCALSFEVHHSDLASSNPRLKSSTPIG
jgi:hypothetical protein